MNIKTTNKVSEKIWGRKAIHIPNTTDIYGADLVSSFVANYMTRTLCLLAKEHKIVLPKTLENMVNSMLEYFAEIGFGYISQDNFIFIDDANGKYPYSSLVLSLSNQIEAFKDKKYTTIVPFTSSMPTEVLGIKFGKKTGMSLPQSEFFNDKALLREMLHEKGILVPSISIVSTIADDYVRKAVDFYRDYQSQGIVECAVILPKACSGYGIKRFNNEAELRKILETVSEEVFMIDPWLSNLGSPAFQICIADKKEDDINLGLSDQMLDGQTHLGNKYKSEFEDSVAVQKICDEMTEILRNKGVRGIVGVDLLIREIDGEIVPYVLEVNARQTGAIYAGFLAYELRNEEKKPWVGHNNVVVPAGYTLKDYHNYLKQQEIAYSYGDEEGVVVTCIGNLEANNKIMILVMANTEERLVQILDIACSCK